MFTAASVLPSRTMPADFNGDGFTDILWRGQDGTLVIWNMDASGMHGISDGIINVPAGLTLRGYGDLTNDGTTDLIFQDGGGLIHTWGILNNKIFYDNELTYQTHSEIKGLADFNGDNHIDLLWSVPPASRIGGAGDTWTTGVAEDRKIPLPNFGSIAAFSADYAFTGVGDFNGDGRDDVLFRGTGNGTVGNFLLQEPVTVAPRYGEMPTKNSFIHDPGNPWNVLTLADFNGDHKTDILWQSDSGEHSVWLMDGNAIIGGGIVAKPPEEWSVIAVQDYNNDGNSDLMWHSAATGWNVEWLMNGNDFIGFGACLYVPGDFWGIVG